MAVRPFTPLLALVVRLLLPPSCLCSEWDVPLFDPDFFTKPTAKPSSGKGTLGESASETGRISGRDAAYWIYPDVRFYEHGLCPHSHRVSLALHWLEIPHTSIEIDLSLPDEGLAWYRKRLGTATVPALEVDTIPSHGEMDLLRSLPTYATPAHRFIPKLRRERIAVEKILGCLATFEQAGWDLIAGGGEDGREVRRGMAAAHWIYKWEQALAPLSNSLFYNGGPYLVGERPTAADAAIAPFLGRFELLARELKGYDTRAAVPRIGKYMEMLERGAPWQKTFPEREGYVQAVERYGRCAIYETTDLYTAPDDRPPPPWEVWDL